EGFSWKQVALSVVSSYVGVSLPSTMFSALGNVGSAIARGALANAITQAVAVVVDLQKKFDWRSVAASGLGAGAGRLVGQALGLTPEGSRPDGMDKAEYFGKTVASSLAAGLTTAAARGGKVAVVQVAADA